MKPSILFPLFLASSVNAYWLPEDPHSGLLKTCTVPKSNGDDAPGIMSTVAKCGNNSKIIFSAGVTYNLDTPIHFSNLNNVEFVFNGNLTLPSNVTAVEAVVGNSKIYPGHWITVSSGTGVTFSGSKKNSGGWFIGHGDLWWPNVNNSNNDFRPHFFSFKATSLRLRDLKILKPVAWVFSIGGDDVYMTNTLLDAQSDDGFAFNTGQLPCKPQIY
jgi:galacturan 1,4-alpha-galacturonidase